MNLFDKLTCVVAIGACLFPVAASAQDSAIATAEIIVIGERVERKLAETHSSVEVFAPNEIDELAAPDRLDQLLQSIPNVTLGLTGVAPAIRGEDATGALINLPAFLGGTRPRMTMQVDGRALGYNELVWATQTVWDVRQVEVFRSPQSTTQGRNAIAGAIFLETNDPEQSWEARARGIVGNYDKRQISAVVNAPIDDHQLALRMTGDLVRSRTTSELGLLARGADPNEDDFSTFRAKLLAQPDALPGVKIVTTLSHLEARKPQIVSVAPPFEERRDPFPRYGVFNTRSNSATIRTDWDVSTDLQLHTTLSLGNGRNIRFAPPGLGETTTWSNDQSLEMIAHKSSTAAGRATFGINLVRQALRQDIDLSAVVGTGSFHDIQNSGGLFGEWQVPLWQSVELTAGLRYQWDSQDRIGSLGPEAAGIAMEFDRQFDALLPKAALAFALSDDLTIGASAQRAYNPGGVVLEFDSGMQRTFDRETLWAYEVFLRAGSAGSPASLSVNSFLHETHGTQRAQFFPYSVPGGGTLFWARIQNVPYARSYGMEASLRWRPINRIDLKAAIGLLDTEIVQTAATDDPIKGNQFSRAPHFTGSASISWRIIDELRLYAQVQHSDNYFSDDVNRPELRTGGATTVNARADLLLGNLNLFGYARNLLDKFYMTNLSSVVSGVAGPPREIGIGAEMRF